MFRIGHNLFFKDASGNLTPVSWEEAIVSVAKMLDSTPGDQIAAVAGGLADAESLMALKDLMNRLGSEAVCTEEIFPDVRFYTILTVFFKNSS